MTQFAKHYISHQLRENMECRETPEYLKLGNIPICLLSTSNGLIMLKVTTGHSTKTWIVKDPINECEIGTCCYLPTMEDGHLVYSNGVWMAVKTHV